jgi:hypothetical protein
MKLSFPVRIYLIALILRLVPVLLARHMGIGLDDMFQYDMLARSISQGHGFRWYAEDDLNLLKPYVNFDLSTASGYDPQYGMYTSFRAPLYPTFLAIVYFLAGTGFERFLAARLAQAIFLGAPLATLTYLIARHLLPESERNARISAWVVAAYPMLLIYPLGLGTENPFFVLLLSSFLFLLKSTDEPSNANLLLSGLFLGLTALTRSVILPFAVLALFYLWFHHRRKALIAVVAFVLCISPWIIRNSLLHGSPTGIETSMGYNLYLGYHPDGDGSFIFGPSLDLLTIMDDSARDEVGTQRAVEFIRAEPERFAPLAINRLGFFFGLEKRVLMYFYSNNILGPFPASALLTVSTILLLPFVVISILAAFSIPFLRRDHRITLLAILFATYILPHVFILAEDRFHLALVPFLAVLALHGWSYLSNREYFVPKSRTLFFVSIVAVILLLANWGLELHRDADKIGQLLGPDGNRTYFPY